MSKEFSLMHFKYAAEQVVSQVTLFKVRMQEAIDLTFDSKAATPSCEKVVKVYKGVGGAISTVVTGMILASCAPAFKDEQRSQISSDAAKGLLLFDELGVVLTEYCLSKAVDITEGAVSLDAAMALLPVAYSLPCDS
ncbi:uncharacterized protein RCC_05299 [Ramularia collo-cygni]|uniref:Uncharacterized protein n=1 Tax=Ramularia collo-cygni TaxID=112498 RepID=A0A2D3UVW9_9PEZI|nr:uncharacterized protein RCC_05299 [Ramularia collo-cygni]CZT19448.1 uncharacterized protein RCC_05299 [Ramularia collo-cygni]